MPMPNKQIRAENEAVHEGVLNSNVILLPGIRHVPRCGRNLALESQSVCDTDAMQTHEESTALKTPLSLQPIGMGIAIQTQVVRVCSSTTGRS